MPVTAAQLLKVLHDRRVEPDPRRHAEIEARIAEARRDLLGPLAEIVARAGPEERRKLLRFAKAYLEELVNDRGER